MAFTKKKGNPKKKTVEPLKSLEAIPKYYLKSRRSKFILWIYQCRERKAKRSKSWCLGLMAGIKIFEVPFQLQYWLIISSLTPYNHTLPQFYPLYIEDNNIHPHFWRGWKVLWKEHQISITNYKHQFWLPEILRGSLHIRLLGALGGKRSVWARFCLLLPFLPLIITFHLLIRPVLIWKSYPCS